MRKKKGRLHTGRKSQHLEGASGQLGSRINNCIQPYFTDGNDNYLNREQWPFKTMKNGK